MTQQRYEVTCTQQDGRVQSYTVRAANEVDAINKGTRLFELYEISQKLRKVTVKVCP